ncbi:hypothetical protein DXT99_23640 [Pontibacter diazotrophicus]|uniref:Uncharacterized protein n=1 Tax=Pontibacter diazotrophicus TaxID=1400979 RepID=A0A3D8L3F0_9BACT|nr:hypothetical protein [Pontibacter diazotrophicus]RDV11900.1 hypothetical protein DXT99_23640 [Pontibacter diazotrophicus]
MAENEGGETKEESTAPSGERPFIPFPRGCALNRPFDTVPLLDVLMENDGPMGMAQSLDHAYATLAEYLANDPNTSGQQYGHILYDLRRLRNALLQGGGWHQL